MPRVICTIKDHGKTKELLENTPNLKNDVDFFTEKINGVDIDFNPYRIITAVTKRDMSRLEIRQYRLIVRSVLSNASRISNSIVFLKAEDFK